MNETEFLKNPRKIDQKKTKNLPGHFAQRMEGCGLHRQGYLKNFP